MSELINLHKNLHSAKNKVKAYKMIIVMSLGVFLFCDVLLILFAVGWGKECYHRGVSDGYKLQRVEENIKKYNDNLQKIENLEKKQSKSL